MQFFVDLHWIDPCGSESISGPPIMITNSGNEFCSIVIINMNQNYIIIIETHLYNLTGSPHLHNRADQALQAKLNFDFEAKVKKNNTKGK